VDNRPVDASPPRLADGVELIGEFTASGFKEAPYIARRPDGQVVQIGKLFYVVAEELDGRAGYDEIAERATWRAKRELDGELVQYIVDEKLRPLGLVATEDGAGPQLSKVDPLLALKFRAGIVPERVVNRVTTIFRPLFLPPVVVGVLAALAALDVWLFGFHGIAQSLRETLYKPAFILLTLALVIVSAAFHECGHATACRYGGARPGKMGVGLYLVWPAFYTDVTDAYRLGRSGRLRTDLGGIYFNAIFILLTAGAYFATGFEPLLLIIPLQHAEILHQLLPVIRLDGYYIVSDLAGVPDMFQRIGPTLKSLLPWRRPEPAVANLKRWVRVAVSAYVLTLVPLLLFVLVVTVMSVPRILATSWDSGSHEYQRIQNSVEAGHWLTTVVGCIQLAVLALIPAGLLLTLAQLGRKTVERAWRTSEGRPRTRAAFALAGLGAATFAIYTWIPPTVYRPIQPDERGTLPGALDRVRAIATGRPALTEQPRRDLDRARSRSHQPRTHPVAPGRHPVAPVRPVPGSSRRGPAPSRSGTGAADNAPAPSPPRPSPTAPSATVKTPGVTVSTPVATGTTPAVTVTTPTAPLPTVTTPTVPLPTAGTPTTPAPTAPTPTAPLPTVTTSTLPLPTP
jgi:putative peptide zinc metalloprotease protein